MELNTICCADALDGIAEVEDGSVEAIITDPPYFSALNHSTVSGSFKFDYTDLATTKPFWKQLLAHFARVLSPTGCLYMFCDFRSYPFYIPLINEVVAVKNCLVWDKKSGMGCSYPCSHEFVIFASRKNLQRRGRNLGTSVIRDIPSCRFDARSTSQRLHPTQKPVELFEKFIIDSTDEGQTVLDCFGGSGTLAIAALKTKRNYIVIEHQEKYVEVAQKRVADFLNNQA